MPTLHVKYNISTAKPHDLSANAHDQFNVYFSNVDLLIQ